MTDRVSVPPAGWDAEGIARLGKAIGFDAGRSRYIGGWVRDALAGAVPGDLDIGTQLRPEDVRTRADAAGLGVWTSPSGLAHGTVGVTIAGKPVEVTTLRRDVSTDGRRATVSFTDDWEEDAARRDFTINALSADPLTGDVFDYFGGVDDLRAGVVRFIGDPLQRIAEDHLRILRFFRFHARFGTGVPEAAAYDACAARANDLMALSRERIADELLKLLGCADPVPAFSYMLARDVLKPVLPEIDDAGLKRLRTLIAAEYDAALPGDAVRRLAALIPPDPARAEDIAARLKLSNAVRKRLSLAVSARPEPPEELAYRIGVESAVDRLLLAGAPQDATRIASWTPPRLPISGGALVTRGLAAGPIVARGLKMVEDRWVAEGFPARDRVDRLADQVAAELLRDQ
ncbi:tRNA nucleotidyltransferase [Sphingomonas changbaiensis NBRC 104936]|uniref:tRNA nucleotidyltransferase n=1 Tax=Sphingomonas changbaiensis NBRC 104936 TaxID=1219043 RepID=A0A0E9MSG4_9SPHN|nr:CCA tRNA nucleotidyltransferase [Sphingomonas changbaiensis]GAO40727.1 tRNA nucleotidyltransferase [Sphingomonas changbaiensis NBRC 104936]